MTDQRLRELERRWKETGTVEDEAAYLLERVRAGDLSRERLELAGYCGHEASTLASSPQPRASETTLIHDWIRYLPGGSAHRIRAAALAADSVLPCWKGGGPAPGDALAAVYSWLACPCDAHQSAAREAHAIADRAVRDSGDLGDSSFLSGMAPAIVARAVAAHDASDCDDWCRRATQCAANAVRGEYDATALQLRATVSAGLILWALRGNL